jgi:type II secretory pathway component PulM
METMTTDTTATPTPSKKPQPKQTSIPGTERKYIEAVENAAQEYRAVRDERMALTKREAELQEILVQAMASHELEAYAYLDDEGEELIVKVTHKTKVRVRKAKNVDDSEDAS